LRKDCLIILFLLSLTIAWPAGAGLLDTIQNGWRVTPFWQVIIFFSPIAFTLAAFGILRAAIRDGKKTDQKERNNRAARKAKK